MRPTIASTNIVEVIENASFLTLEQKEYFLSKIPTLTEEGKVQITAFLQNAVREYEEEEKRIEQKYLEQLQEINREVDRDFMMAKKLIEASLDTQDDLEEAALLSQL